MTKGYPCQDCGNPLDEYLDGAHKPDCSIGSSEIWNWEKPTMTPASPISEYLGSGLGLGLLALALSVFGCVAGMMICAIAG